MHVRARPGLDFNGLQPLVFGEVGWNLDVLILDRAGGRNLERLGHREHGVGLADGPPVDERRSRGKVLVVPFRRARIHPRRNRVDLGLREAGVVLEVADRGIGAPRRHLARDDALLDRPRPGPGLFERHQRHRREHGRPVAFDAVLVEDRRDVLGEGDRRRGRASPGAAADCPRTTADTPSNTAAVVPTIRIRMAPTS